MTLCEIPYIMKTTKRNEQKSVRSEMICAKESDSKGVSKMFIEVFSSLLFIIGLIAAAFALGRIFNTAANMVRAFAKARTRRQARQRYEKQLLRQQAAIERQRREARRAAYNYSLIPVAISEDRGPSRRSVA